jgi:hypothetical protein
MSRSSIWFGFLTIAGVAGTFVLPGCEVDAHCFGDCQDEIVTGGTGGASGGPGGSTGGGIDFGGSNGDAGSTTECQGIDTTIDIQNCGACGNSCVRAGAIAACTTGVCSFVCATGNYDLDGKPENGCEYNCSPSAGGKEVCDAVDNDCDGKIDEGFTETFATDPNNCGGCNRQCLVDNGLAACVGGKCVAEVCNSGFTDDPKTPELDCNYKCQPNGTEVCGDGVDNDCNGKIDDAVGLDEDPVNCGECNKPCVGLANTQPKCAAGTCVQSDVCAPGYFDEDGDPSNGCEAACASECNIPFAVTQCQPTCKFVECFPNYYDLDGKQGNGSNGCEYSCVKTSETETCDGKDNNCDGQADEGIDLQTDAENCGACGVKCALLFPHADGTCQAGTCVFTSCKAGFNDANGTQADGCEYACVKQNGGQELCNDLDDDCNGSVDDSPVEVGKPCGVDQGACSPGYQVCQNGSVQCVGEKGPKPEVCDAPTAASTARQYDNDCDGKTDSQEGCAYPSDAQSRLDGGTAGTANTFQLAVASADDDFLVAFSDARNVKPNGKLCSGTSVVDTAQQNGDRIGNIDIFTKASTTAGTSWGTETKVGGDLDPTGSVSCGAATISLAEMFIPSTLEPSAFLRKGRGYVAFSYFAEDQARVRRIYVTAANAPYTSWTTSQRIDVAGTDKNVDLFAPQGIVAKAGTSAATDVVAVIWSSISGTATSPQRDVWLSHSTNGGTAWKTPVKVNTQAGKAELPTLATDGKGKVFLAWRATDTKRTTVRTATVTGATATFTAEKTLQPSGSSAERVVIAADGGTNVHVAWLDIRSGGDGKTIRVSTSTDGGATWPTDGFLANPDGSYADAAAPSITAFAGRAALVWEDTRNGAPDIYVNRWAGSWGTKTARADGDTTPGKDASYAPAVALGPNNVVYVAWRDFQAGATPGIFVNVSLDDGATFGATASGPIRLDSSGNDDTQDARMLAATSSPKAAAIWIRAAGTKGDKGDVYTRNIGQ